MNQREEEDWCEMNRSDFVKNDCLISSFPSSDLQHYTDCCSSCSRNDLDDTYMPLGTLEKPLNLASNIFDVKIQINNKYPNVPEELSLNPSYSSSSKIESNAGQSFPEDEEECHFGLKAYTKTRQKMHEMAVKQKLITEQDPKGHGFLHLSSEEKRALLQEGYKLPTMLPLTKSEENALKIIRRKIKNKLSAQESRRKRREYMNALEKRIQYYRAENSALKLKLKDLEQRNRSLAIELRNFKTTMASNHNTEYHPSCPTPNATTIN